MSSLIAFINTVPSLVKLVTLFVEKWQDYQFSKIEETYRDIDSQRHAVLKAIKKAENDEERKQLIKLLYKIKNNSISSNPPSKLRN